MGWPNFYPATVHGLSRRSTLASELPKQGGMAQVSRPFQVLLVVFALFVAVWFVALRGHSRGSGASSSAPSSVASAPKPKTPSSVYTGPAPGVSGLTRAIAKAHGAVKASQQSAKQLAEKSAAASSAAVAPKTGAPPASSAHPGASGAPAAPVSSARSSRPGSAHVTGAPAQSTARAPESKAAEARSGPARTPARQALVERALKEGKVAVILFWSPKGSDDAVDRAELRLLEEVHHLIPSLAKRVPTLRAEIKRSGLELEKKFAAFEAQAGQVTSFGSITRGVQVYGTPTILVVNPHGRVSTLTGLTDAYSIEQTIDEARHL
jgi:hypothetical protein